MTKANPGTVYLVGAGPGDPELLTVKAVSLLQTADVVLHDDLVPQCILALAGRQTAVVSVGKRCGKKKVTQEQINERMISSAGLGLSVVRLKSGDPLVFGRLGEELDALRTAGISFEVVPGISAGFAAAASLGLSLTDRRSNSRVLMASGHQAQKSSHPAVSDLAQFELGKTTLMIYMPGADLSEIRDQLLGSGMAPMTPCVIVSRATMYGQRQICCTVEKLNDQKAVEPPSILLVGVPLEAASRSLVPQSADSADPVPCRF